MRCHLFGRSLAAEPVRDGEQCLVAGVMAEAVIDLLEAIQVGARHTHVTVGGPAAGAGPARR